MPVTPPATLPREAVVLGMGGCVDYEVRVDAPTLQALAAEHRLTAADLEPVAADAAGPIRTERDLVRSVLGYLRTGSGGEHFVASSAVLESFAARFHPSVALGGTSVRAGIVLARLGIGSLLHLVSTNDHVRALLPDGVDWISSSTDDTLYPHLIVQYPAGLRVAAPGLELTSPAANRLIYVNDPDNDTLLLREDLGDHLARARVLLLSGFNAIRDPAVLDVRLAELRTHLQRLPAAAFVHFEDAAYHEPALGARVRAAVLDRVDVLGLNEDELRGHLGRPVDLRDATDVARAVTALHAQLPARNLVVHTASWSLVHGPDADALAPALDAGMAVASLRYAVGDDWTREQLAALAAGPRDAAATALAAELEVAARQLRCRPGFRVVTARPTTVGLGDSFVGGFLAHVTARLG